MVALIARPYNLKQKIPPICHTCPQIVVVYLGDLSNP